MMVCGFMGKNDSTDFATTQINYLRKALYFENCLNYSSVIPTQHEGLRK